MLTRPRAKISGGGAFYPKSIAYSLRTDPSRSTTLSKTFGTPTNQKIFTISTWVKRTTFASADSHRFMTAHSGDGHGWLGWYSDQLYFDFGGQGLYFRGMQRDASSFSHIMLVVDTTQATSTNRVKCYQNGVQLAYVSGSYPALNATGYWNQSGIVHRFGIPVDNTQASSAYFADTYFIDGQALTPSSFGQASSLASNVWVAKVYTGTYGNNGYLQEYLDGSTLGKDTSPINLLTYSEDYTNAAWSKSAITATSTTRVTPTSTGGIIYQGATIPADTLTRCVWWKIGKSSASTYITLSAYATGGTTQDRNGVFNPSTGLFSPNSGTVYGVIDLGDAWLVWIAITNNGANTTLSSVMYPDIISGNRYVDCTANQIEVGSTPSVYQPTTSTAKLSNNFASSGFTTADQMGDTPTNNFCVLNSLDAGTGAISNGALTMAAGGRTGTFFVSSGKYAWKYTQTAAGNLGIITTSGTKITITGANNDVIELEMDLGVGTLNKRVNGGSSTSVATGLLGTYGPYFEAPGTAQFAYTPTDTGYKTLCTANMPAPAEYNSPKAVDAKLHTGNGTSQNITSYSMAPDLVICRNRAASLNNICDSVRGATKMIYTDSTAAEVTDATRIAAFLTNGFSVGSAANVNANAASIVSWGWKRAAKYGFDIVTWTGNGANRTIAHALGKAPTYIMVKDLDSANAWVYYHAGCNATPQNYYVPQDSTGVTASATMWNNTAPTSSVFSVGTAVNVNASGHRYVAYVFTDIPGLCQFGYFLGNSSADGPMLNLGFRPRIFSGRIVTACNNKVWDAVRGPTNPNLPFLYTGYTGGYAEQSNTGEGIVDFVSNGVKIRAADAPLNSSGVRTIYCAWAEAPFPWANAR